MDYIVLLVDDDETILHALGRRLRKQPYRLYTARSGEEAMLILKARDVNVIVTDERMPGMSGNDLLAWVAQNYPDVMRIILTGHASTANVIRAINQGAVYQFLIKPCDEVELAIAIRKALEHSDLLKENSRLVEQTKRQFEELEDFDRRLEVLTRVVSRDIEVPLRTILCSCRSLEERYGEFFEPKVVELLKDASTATAEVQRSICNLLDRSLEELPAKPADQVCSDLQIQIAAK